MKSFYRNKNILITGGLGFIGSNMAKALVNLGANVTIVDSLIPEYGGNLFNIYDLKDHVKVNISDVRDEHSLKFLVRKQDLIFNLAGQTSHMDSMSDPFTDLEINAAAQLSLLECCRKYNNDVKVVFASTRQLYGRPEYLPVDEKHPLNPVDVNGINKLAGERYHILYNNVYKIRSSVLRLTNTYGPGMRIIDARQTFLGIWIKNVLLKKPFEVWGGAQLRDYNYVDDVIKAFLMVGANEDSNGKIYNLGSKEILSLTQTASTIREVQGDANYIMKVFPDDRKKIDIGDYYTDYSFINQTIGWKPSVKFKEGIKRTLIFYQENLEQYLS